MKTKEDNHEAFNGISFLSETAINFTTAGINQRIYTYIASCLSTLNPEAYILVNSLDEENKLVRNEALITNSETLHKIISTLGFSPKQKTFPLDDSIYDLIDGTITKFNYGIYEMSFKTIPKSVASALEKVLNIGEIYGIAFVVEKRIFAVAALIFPKGKIIQHIEILETFVRQASVTLKRIEAEKNEEKYRSLFEYMSQGAFYQNADGHFADVNDAALKIFGLSREEFLNINPQNAKWDVLDENLSAVPTENTPSVIALKKGIPVNNSILGVFNPQKQDYVWISINAIPEFIEGEIKPYRVFVTMHDVTELKNKEAELKKSEEKYKALFNNSMTGTFRSKLDGSAILDLNQKAADTLGYTIAEMLDSPSTIHYANTKDREEVIRLIEGEGSFTNLEISFRTKTDKIRNVLMACRADFEQGVLEGSFIDITERELLIKALKESEEKWRKLVETLPDYVALYDENGLYLFLNHFAEGFSQKDIEGKTYADFMPNQTRLVFDKAILKAKQSKLTQVAEYIAYGDNYSLRHYESYFVPIFENDKIINMMVIARDITRNKEIELQLKESLANVRAIMESTDDVFILLHKNGILIDCNDAHAKRLNTNREELLGKNIFDLLPEDIAKQRYEIVQKVASTGKAVYSEDYRGGYWNEFVIQPVFDENVLTDKVAVFSKDITERKRIEKEILEHQQLLKSVTSEVQAILFALDTNGVFTFSDGRGLEKLGLKPAQVVGMSAVELYRDNPNILDAIEKSLKGIIVKTESLELAGFYYDTLFQPIFDNEGIVISVIGLAIDVTETKKIQNELLESRRELSTLMDNMPGMVYSCENDSQWTMKFISVGSFELTGYRPEELIDNKEISFEEIIHADDRQLVWDNVQEGILNNKAFNIEYRIITKSGQIKHVWERGSLQYDSEKNKQLLEGFITDISEKKEFEEALQSNYSLMRMAGKTARFGGWSVDFETNTALWSDQVREIHEMPKEYMPIVDEGISFYAPEWKEKITRIFTDCAQNGIPYDEEMEIITGKGKRIWIRTTGEAVKDESGKITKVHGSFQNIHDYKLITEALKENEARLKELNATKDKFFSIIAHDLRSPFAGIMGLSEILVDNIQEKDYENIERIGSLILESSQKALALLTNLLEWSRSQTGRMEFLPEYLQIVPLIKETAALFNEAAAQKSITIDFQLPKNPIVFLDKAMISTVLRNLISNAVKFTRPQGKIIIKLNISSEVCEFSVQDNGVGIAKEDLEKLFRIEESYSTRGTNNEKGTGLGLILSKEFVEKHGGHIHAISKKGFGSTFSFTIPFNKTNNNS
jgi:PAS domain S-box-containing protein